MNCIICKSNNTRFYFKKNGCFLYKCADCGLIFVSPLPREVGAIYNEKYFCGEDKQFGYIDYDKDKELMRNVFLKYLKIIAVNFEKAQGKKLLDIGAATGFFVNLAREYGFDAEGIEISKWASEQGRKKGLKIQHGALDTIQFPENSFDVITLFDVLEHISAPDVFLEKIFLILKKDGVLIINTPDAKSVWLKILGKKWQALIPPEHLFLYNKNNIEIFLNKHNFKILKIKIIGKSFTLSYIFHILYNSFNFSLFQKLSSFFNNDFFNKIAVPLNTRDNMFVVAKKD